MIAVGLLWGLATVIAAIVLSALAIGLWRLIDGYAFTACEWLVDRINDALDRVEPAQRERDEHEDGGP